MFSQESLLFYNKKAIKLAAPQQNSSMTIIPEQGGIVASLVLNGQEQLAQIQSEQELKENPWGKSALLYPFPNRLKAGHFVHCDKEYQFPINDQNTGNALHGFGANLEMNVADVNLQNDSASLLLNLNYQGQHSFYPWSFRLSIKYTLTLSGFELQMEISNESKEAFPFGFGWHPYFLIQNAGNCSSLKLPGAQRIDIDEYMIPTGKRERFTNFADLSKIDNSNFDTGFELVLNGKTSSVTLSHCDNSELTFWQESGPEEYRFLQVFIPPDRNSIALEPMTCNIDAFNNKEGLWILQPGERRSLKCGVKVENT